MDVSQKILAAILAGFFLQTCELAMVLAVVLVQKIGVLV